MTLRLTIHRAAWQAHVHAAAQAYGPALVPVVKGNGYGFGRPLLHAAAASPSLSLPPEVCVGTVHELADVPPKVHPTVLTPTLATPHDRPDATLTVGSEAHVAALSAGGWRGRVIVKLASSMRRYGADAQALPAVCAAAVAAGLEPVAYALHLPLAGTDADRTAEIEAWLLHLPPDGLPLWLSHLRPAAFHALVAAHPERPLRIRIGTGLWHGSPRGPFLHLAANVVDARPIAEGEPAGYRLTPAPATGTLIAVGVGSTHGVSPLEHDDPTRRSPFHFAHQRLPLLERPHMHTTLCVVPAGQPCPTVGDWVDVQQPLITVHPDELDWQP